MCCSIAECVHTIHTTCVVKLVKIEDGAQSVCSKENTRDRKYSLIKTDTKQRKQL